MRLLVAKKKAKAHIPQNRRDSLSLSRRHTLRRRIAITTTDTLEGYNITEYLGIVTGTGLLPGGGSGKLADKLWSQAIQDATESLGNAAAALGADAVIGVRCEAEKLARLIGTAVRLG